MLVEDRRIWRAGHVCAQNRIRHCYRYYKGEFRDILLTGNAPGNLKSQYAINYRFFQDKISDFKDKTPDYFSFLPMRILQNCILLPIKAESQDTALRIFSTLNDRGMPLSDSDIFKAQLYKAFSDDGLKNEFIADWKELENLCGKIFQLADNPMDEIFTRYMYFERAKRDVRVSTLEGLRKFYEADNYSFLKKYHHQTFSNIKALADFWNDVANQDGTKFSERVLRRLFVLNYAPNSMWTYITSVYFLQNRDLEGLLDDDDFYEFLTKITAFIWAFTILRPGVNILRTPIFAEMLNIVNGRKVTFDGFAFNINELQNALNIYTFSNNRPITRSFLAWFAFTDPEQIIIPLETVLEIEHIYARNRLPVPENIEAIGNKSLLEKKINIHAANYKFQDKAKYYLGQVKNKPATNIHELQSLAVTMNDFMEQDISQRTEKIITTFITSSQKTDSQDNSQDKKIPPEAQSLKGDILFTLEIKHVLHVRRPRKFYSLFQHSKCRAPGTCYAPAVSISSFKHSEKLFILRVLLH